MIGCWAWWWLLGLVVEVLAARVHRVTFLAGNCILAQFAAAGGSLAASSGQTTWTYGSNVAGGCPFTPMVLLQLSAPVHVQEHVILDVHCTLPQHLSVAHTCSCFRMVEI